MFCFPMMLATHESIIVTQLLGSAADNVSSTVVVSQKQNTFLLMRNQDFIVLFLRDLKQKHCTILFLASQQ